MVTVRCPNCEATYQLDPAKLAHGGRKLKCAQCQTVWVATMPEADVPVVPEVPVEVPVAAPKPVVTDAVPEAAAVPEPVAVPEVKEEPVADEPLVQRTPNVEALVHVGGWRQWVRGENIWRTGAVGFVVLGVVAGVGVGAWRFWPAKVVEKPEVVVEAKPETVENNVVTPPKGIVLHRVRGEVTPMDDAGGGVALTVRGLLANVTSDTLVVPALRLELLGADGKVADMWPVSGVSGKIEPHSEQAWTVSLTAPDMSSLKGWRVVFVDENATEGVLHPAGDSAKVPVAPEEGVDDAPAAE